MASVDIVSSFTWVLVYLLTCVIGYVTYKIAYNAFFHPLAKSPGPRSAAISNFSLCYWFLEGRQPYRILDLHKRYGPIVRIAPDDLSFNTAQSWRDIYEPRNDNTVFLKSKFYEGGSFADQCGSIVSERDPAAHKAMRRFLSHAFSQQSLGEQEHIIAEKIDTFIHQIGQYGSTEEGVEISRWHNMMTFDIIGDLAFGESFGGLESGKIHPWIDRLLKALRKGALVECFRRFPLMSKVAMLLFARPINEAIKDTKTNEQYSIDLVKRRISRDTARNDFLSRILEHRESVADVQIAAHASDLVLAGSETTATCLSCIAYYLLHDPQVLGKLQNEIRSAFGRYEDINSLSTNSLPYLHAVCLEGLRMFPPLPFALPRIVPDGGRIVDGHFVPGGTIVSTAPIAACLNEANFPNPLEFRPERWLDKGPNKLDASQPFSLGPRGCLGRSLAWMELHTTLAKLHFKYDLEQVGPPFDWHEAARMYTLWQTPSLSVRVVPRQ